MIPVKISTIGITALASLIVMFSSGVGVALTSALVVGFSTMWSPKFVDSLMARLKAMGAPKVPWLRLEACMLHARSGWCTILSNILLNTRNFIYRFFLKNKTSSWDYIVRSLSISHPSRGYCLRCCYSQRSWSFGPRCHRAFRTAVCWSMQVQQNLTSLLTIMV